MSNVYEDFAGMYINDFMEVMSLGCSGGLYGQVIEIEEGEEGIFDKDALPKYVMFRHGDNDYDYEFGRRGNDELENNPDKLASAFLKLLEAGEYTDDYYPVEFPCLIDNTKKSLKSIAGS